MSIIEITVNLFLEHLLVKFNEWKPPEKKNKREKNREVAAAWNEPSFPRSIASARNQVWRRFACESNISLLNILEYKYFIYKRPLHPHIRHPYTLRSSRFLRGEKTYPHWIPGTIPAPSYREALLLVSSSLWCPVERNRQIERKKETREEEREEPRLHPA